MKEIRPPALQHEETWFPHLGWMVHESGDEVARRTREGNFESLEQVFAWLYLRNGDNFVDGGAHIGLYSVLAGKAVGPSGRVVSVEPGEKTSALLRSNLRANGIENADVIEVAIWKESGTVAMAAGEPQSSHSYVPQSGQVTSPKIPALTLTDVLERAGIGVAQFVKLDVEGSEFDALDGAALAISSARLPLLMVEFAEENLLRAGKSGAALHQRLTELEYEVCRFSAECLRLVRAPYKGPIEYENLFAVKDLVAANQRLADASGGRKRIAGDILSRFNACGTLQRACDERAHALYEQAREMTLLRRLAEERLAAVRSVQQEADNLRSRSASLTLRLEEMTVAKRVPWSAREAMQLFRLAAHDAFAEAALSVTTRLCRKMVGRLIQYAPRPVQFPPLLPPRIKAEKYPSIAVVTPSYMHGNFLEATLQSVLDQRYPKLHYAVQDACSKDATPEVLERYRSRIDSVVIEKDAGQADAIQRGFERVSGDIMAWLNSDDLFVPGALHYVGAFFAANPDVDVIYGDRILIDGNGRDVGHWYLPEHKAEVLRWVDYVPQETLFWRKELWEAVGGIDTSFQFALDWDLLLRFQNAGARIVRIPHFLGCFRVHAQQKTSSSITSVGHQEMQLLRQREHGEGFTWQQAHRQDRHIRLQSALERFRRRSSP